MKALLSTLVVLFVIGITQAQIEFKSGDKELDAELNVLNTEAKKDLLKFKEQTAKDLNISKDKIQSLLDKKMEPAEIILSVRIAKQSGKTVDEVVKSYEKNKGKGWGVVAKEMGIKPGSKEFHALKGKSGKGKPAGKGNTTKPQPESKPEAKPQQNETPVKGKKKG